MNADHLKFDDTDPVHELLAKLVWQVQDLQKRVRLDGVPPQAFTAIDEVKRLTDRIHDYLHSAQAANIQPAEPPGPAGQVLDQDDEPDEDPFEGDPPKPAIAAAPPAKSKKGGKS